ncbi:MAG: GAF domain-containing sensor histidine kinase [Thainema sp.]
MISPEIRLACRIDGAPHTEREQKRLDKLTTLKLLSSDSVPIFDEATQMAARYLELPICTLSVIDQKFEWLKSAIGLSRLGLMNQLAASRHLLREDSFGTYVVDSQQALVISDAIAHPAFQHSTLVAEYGIRSYLGVPLLTSDGYCLGVLAVMDLKPHAFGYKDIEFLELEARWSISELERYHLNRLNHQPSSVIEVPQVAAEALPTNLQIPNPVQVAEVPVTNSIRVELIAQLAQELRTPLTSIMGMTSVLGRKIYGPLTQKQQEYIDIMGDSSHCLLSLVDEITELGQLDDHNQTLNLAPVDIEMICQQAIKTLTQFAHRQDQKIQLSVEPGPRIWLLDKEKVRQMLYHLTFSIIRCSCAGSIVQIHVSRKPQHLNIAVWVSNPWLSNGFSSVEITSNLAAMTQTNSRSSMPASGQTMVLEEQSTDVAAEAEATDANQQSRENLALLLSRQLAELHGGEIRIQGSQESGLRYVISLPTTAEVDPVA